MICRSTDRWSGWALRENSTTALLFSKASIILVSGSPITMRINGISRGM
jgi:hypothetical protein